MVGNNNSHAKNSIYFPPNLGARLSSFYDLLCTSIYPGLSSQFAFKVGEEAKPSQISKAHIGNMAKELGFKERYVLKTGQELAENLQAQLATVAREMNSVATPGTEQAMIERLTQHISSNTKQLQKRFFGNEGN